MILLPNSDSPWTRRSFLRAGAAVGAGWLTQAAYALAREGEAKNWSGPPQSIICLWLTGGPSQLETFDPHPGKEIAHGTQAISTRLPGVQLAKGFERTAEEMHSISLIRSMVTREADHIRGSYLMKTGYSPDLTVMHPSLGAVVCHELPNQTCELPRHVSILGAFFPRSDQPARGGYLGSEFDAFKLWDPASPVPNVRPLVDADRNKRRMADVSVVDAAFARRLPGVLEQTKHETMLAQGARMMSSAQLRAFDVSEEPKSLLESYGDTAFGRGCLAARRLIEVGVRAVEVTLNDWDTHQNNHETHRELIGELDPAFSTLIRDLRERGLLDRTIVLCGGEFGRTPTFNYRNGRDHWTQGFSIAAAGGGLRRGVVLGETDPEGGPVLKNKYTFPDLYATLLTALGINPAKEHTSTRGQTVKLSSGKIIEPLLERRPAQSA